MAALLLAGAPASASLPQVGIMGLRPDRPGLLTGQTVQAANHVLWQAAATVPGVRLRLEPDIAATLGAAARHALATCAADACMADVGRTAGLNRVVYAVAAPQGGGFVVQVRSVSVQPLALLAQTSQACDPCNEAAVVQLLDAMSLPSMVAVGGTAAPELPASLSVTSKPAGARVTLSGRMLGITPLKAATVAPGNHLLRLDMAGYQPVEETLTAQPGQKIRKKVKLKRIPPHTGHLTVKSAPAGALVFLGGQPAGTTPLARLEVLQGRHGLTVRKDGYQPYESIVAVRGGGHEKVMVKLVRLPPTTGRLTLSSSPSGATVTLGGQVVGTTPMKGVELYPGDHTLLVSLDGYHPRTERVAVRAGKTTRHKVKLARVPATTGTLVVETDPSGALVTCNGSPLGYTPLTVSQLAPGQYPITMQMAGWSPAYALVQVKAGETTEVKRALRR